MKEPDSRMLSHDGLDSQIQELSDRQAIRALAALVEDRELLEVASQHASQDAELQSMVADGASPSSLVAARGL